MKIGFAGTPEFARVALARLGEAGFDIRVVLTQPDRPAGRGQTLQPSAVKRWALEHGVLVLQPISLRLDGSHAADAATARAVLAEMQLDVLVVAAYGLILPEWALTLPRLGALNIHASLLPRWRGAAPIQRAIEDGDVQTGITIMQMDAGLDTGAMLMSAPMDILPIDTAGSLHDRLAQSGSQLILQSLRELAKGPVPGLPQSEEGVTYARKIDKKESYIDWTPPADLVARRIRAFNPAPGASSHWRGELVKVWNARAEDVAALAEAPGTVVSASHDGVTVACGTGSVVLTELQRAGGKRLPASAFLQGETGVEGDRFGIKPSAREAAGGIKNAGPRSI
jgi:methionyl-tRNA formyltransferase